MQAIVNNLNKNIGQILTNLQGITGNNNATEFLEPIINGTAACLEKELNNTVKVLKALENLLDLQNVTSGVGDVVKNVCTIIICIR